MYYQDVTWILSSKFPTSFERQEGGEQLFFIAFVYATWLGGKKRKFRINHIFIIFTLVAEKEGSKRRFIQNGRDFVEFIRFYGWAREWENLIAFCISFAIPHRKLLIKISKESFQMYIKIYSTNIFNRKMYIEDKSPDIFCYSIKF